MSEGMLRPEKTVRAYNSAKKAAGGPRLATDNLAGRVSDRGGFRGFLRIFVKNRVAPVGAAIAIFFVFLAVFAPLLSPYDPTAQNLNLRIAAPSLSHPFGTDDIGRDMLSRIIYGTRTSLLIGVVAVSIAMALGLSAGVSAGYYGGKWDLAIMRGVDILMTIPSIVLAIALISALGPGAGNVMLAVGISTTPAFARLSRSIILTLRSLDFVTAARVAGASDRRIMILHMLPNALGPIMVQASLGAGTAILTAASLSFLGLGVVPPEPEWGALLSRGRTYVSLAPHLVIAPGMAIALLVLGFNLLGDGLRDALDPRLKNIGR